MFFKYKLCYYNYTNIYIYFFGYVYGLGLIENLHHANSCIKNNVTIIILYSYIFIRVLIFKNIKKINVVYIIYVNNVKIFFLPSSMLFLKV